MGIDVPGDISGTGRGVIGSDPRGSERPRGGLRVLVPGYPQWWWGQRERGLILFGSFAAALAVGLFLWGTVTGAVLLIFAYMTHAVSTSDALTQESFPPRRGTIRGIGVSCGLAIGIYFPLLTWLTLVAWPGMRHGPNEDGYLVNCSAYRKSEPRHDEWVCYRATPRGEPRVGRVVAVDGQEVEWAIDTLRVNGLRVDGLLAPFRGTRLPLRLSYRMPEGHMLINNRDRPTDGSPDEGLVIVSRDQILGRAWARIYPIRERQLLLTGPRASRSQES